MDEDIRAALAAKHLPAPVIDRILALSKNVAEKLHSLGDPATGRIDPGRIGSLNLDPAFLNRLGLGSAAQGGAGKAGGIGSDEGFTLPGREDLGSHAGGSPSHVTPGQGPAVPGAGGKPGGFSLPDEGGLTLPGRSDLGATKKPGTGHSGGIGGGLGTGSFDDGSSGAGARGKVPGLGHGRPRGGGNPAAAGGENESTPAPAPATTEPNQSTPDQNVSIGPSTSPQTSGPAAPAEKNIDPRTRDDSIQDDWVGGVLLGLGFSATYGAVAAGTSVAKEVIAGAIGEAIMHFVHKVGGHGRGGGDDKRPTDDQVTPGGPKSKAGQTRVAPAARLASKVKPSK